MLRGTHIRGRFQGLIGRTWLWPAAAIALLATAASACFGSRGPLISAQDSDMAFGPEGVALRVTYAQFGGPAHEAIRFAWRDGAYWLSQGPLREPAAYRLQKLEGDWYIWAKFDASVTAYGLARIEGNRLWAYAPECAHLSEAQRQALATALQPNGTCWLANPAQLKAAMHAALINKPQLIGYYETLP